MRPLKEGETSNSLIYTFPNPYPIDPFLLNHNRVPFKEWVVDNYTINPSL